jgi:UDP-N-acetylmuramoylalanine--D-glutamate ligase
MMKLNGIKTLVVGLGKTGLATARFLSRRGAQVTVTDRRQPSELREAIKEMESLGVLIEVGGHKKETFLNSDLIVPSPGVSMYMEELVESRAKGIKIVSEIELAAQFFKPPIIAVTGTNGKSTVVTLLGEIFRASNINVFVGGNLGMPFIEAVESGKSFQYAILEISSFQLEWIEKFRPYIAVVLNITQDHLERYPDFKTYVNTKKNIFVNQKRSDFAVLNADDPNTAEIVKDIRSRIFLFSGKDNLRKGAYLKGNKIIYAIGEIVKEIEIKNIYMRGKHNLENIMAAVIVSSICNCDEEAMKKTIDEFKGLPHRIQFVREVSGVKYYDDSKGTNVDAVLRALECFSSPVILIAGGRDKESDFSPLKVPVKRKVKTLILLGEAKEKIAQQLQGSTEIMIVKDMKEAVEQAHSIAKKGDVVLLSPACASQDMFADYVERGNVFVHFVRGLEEKNEP